MELKELQKKTLASYLRAAIDNKMDTKQDLMHKRAVYNTGQARRSVYSHKRETDALIKTGKKRTKGINLAIKKLER